GRQDRSRTRTAATASRRLPGHRGAGRPRTARARALVGHLYNARRDRLTARGYAVASKRDRRPDRPSASHPGPAPHSIDTMSARGHRLAARDSTEHSAVVLCECGRSFLGIGWHRVGDAAEQWRTHSEARDDSKGGRHLYQVVADRPPLAERERI